MEPQIRPINIGLQIGDSLYDPNQAKTDENIHLVFKEVETKLPDIEKAAKRLEDWLDRLPDTMTSTEVIDFLDNALTYLELHSKASGAAAEKSGMMLQTYLSQLRELPPSSVKDLKKELQYKIFDLRAAKELYTQCRELHQQKIYYNENQGDYCAFPARMALLCYKTGMTPMIHCKSGNNRTSRVVEETKLLAAEVDSNIGLRLLQEPSHNNLIPKSGKLSALRQVAAGAFFLGVGTQEMQVVNSGGAGSREYYNLSKRIENPNSIREYQGVYKSFMKRWMPTNS